jgi:hypothetical protein
LAPDILTAKVDKFARAWPHASDMHRCGSSLGIEGRDHEDIADDRIDNQGAGQPK